MQIMGILPPMVVVGIRRAKLLWLKGGIMPAVNRPGPCSEQPEITQASTKRRQENI